MPKNGVAIFIAVLLAGVSGFLLGLVAAVDGPAMPQQIAAGPIDIASREAARDTSVASGIPASAHANGSQASQIEELDGELNDLRNELAQVRARARSVEADANKRIVELNRKKSYAETRLHEFSVELHRMAEARATLREQLERARQGKAQAEKRLVELRATHAEGESKAHEAGTPEEKARSPERGASPLAHNTTALAERDGLKAGIEAYRAGNYGKAYEIWLPLAKNGVARAQFHIGALYYEGRGIGRDLVSAYVWLDAAACAGVNDAKELRAHVERRMDRKQIVMAQMRISEEQIRRGSGC